MRYLSAFFISLFMLPNAFAIVTCEKTVVPLALAMARGSDQSALTQKLFIDVSADYSEIVVTLASPDYSREGKFRMVMGEEYVRRRNCVVEAVEAVR